MRVSLFAVCHNSYRESLIFLDSISRSVKDAEVELDIFFIDNSSKVDNDSVKLIKSYRSKFGLHYIKSENLGYFPSINFAINEYAIILSTYEYTIISNVDVSVSERFFITLESLPVLNNIGIYAPSIRSNTIGVDRNPKINKRPSYLKLKINQQLFRYSVTYFLLKLVNIIRLKLIGFSRTSSSKNIKVSAKPGGHKIYAPHGSFMIFTREFTKHNCEFNYPVFLFGEEVYVAEKSIEYNLDIIYLSDLIIFDDEHASTSLLKTEIYRKHNYEALSYILKYYFQEKI
jgi:hypothetical protein